MNTARNYSQWKVPSQFYCLSYLLENEKEKYDCAIGTSLMLTLLFAYDGVILGAPQVNFWIYLALPHTVLALLVAGYIWKRGLLHSFPTAYILGFTVFLILAFLHQQTFLQNQRDWRGTPNNVILTRRYNGHGISRITESGSSDNRIGTSI
jgi:hypothetical protein